MKRVWTYLKFIVMGLVGTLVLIFGVNQMKAERDLAVDEIIKSYQPELEKNDLAENPLYQFLQQNQPTPELMAVYAHLLANTEIPPLPPRLSVYKPIETMSRWNEGLLKHAENQSERAKLAIFSSILESSSKLLENRITVVELNVFISIVRRTLDWAAEQKWTPKSIEPLTEISKKVSALIEKRETLVKNALKAERDFSFEIVLNADFSRSENSGRTFSSLGPSFFDRNETLNFLNARSEKLEVAANCIQDYTCDKQSPEKFEFDPFSMLRNPMGKALLTALNFHESMLSTIQENVQKLEQSHKNFASIL